MPPYACRPPLVVRLHPCQHGALPALPGNLSCTDCPFRFNLEWASLDRRRPVVYVSQDLSGCKSPEEDVSVFSSGVVNEFYFGELHQMLSKSYYDAPRRHSSIVKISWASLFGNHQHYPFYLSYKTYLGKRAYSNFSFWLCWAQR